MPAGVAFDGSPWVTAASSAGLVLVSLGAAVGGGMLLARRIAKEGLGPSPGGMQQPDTVRRRSMPIQKSSDAKTADVPPPADSVDQL